ncbi:hypothetical protein RYX36_022190 [Vicia faba]
MVENNFSDMFGLQPTVVTYGSIADELTKIGRLDETYILFEEAKSIGDFTLICYRCMTMGCSPDLMLLNSSYMDCVFKADEVEKGMAAGCSPD